ncbi:signal transduction histidine kinase [Arthrobacter sp. CAN_A214]|uniref:sensor histidine kinase n=1 Tax=Arthrobacter sp. CAN_A214 TaxID=2787720 RepID=UPI0018C984A4
MADPAHLPKNPARSGRHAGRRRKIVLSESALTVTLFLTVVLGLIQNPRLLESGSILAGLLLHLVVLTACVAIPWSGVPIRTALIIPLMDFVALGFIRSGAGESLSGVGLLAAFPVVWLAASRVSTAVAVGASFVGSVSLVWLPLLLTGDDLVLRDFLQPLLLPVMLTGLAVFVSALTRDRRSQQEALRASQAALRASSEAGRKRERLLGTVLDTVDVGVLAVDANGHDILMNARQRAVHAAASPPGNDDPNESQLLVYGSDRESLLPPEERPVRRAVLGEDLTAEQIWLGEGRNQRSMSISSRSMIDEDGAFAGTVISFMDVTDLALALQAKDDFLSNVSHEFRTPLTSILGYLELTMESGESLPAAVQGYMEVARRNALRLEQLVEDLLAINAGTFEVRREQCDVGRILSDAASSVRVKAQRAGVEVVNSSPPGLIAVADPGRLAQAVDNLISNAVKYNRRGGTITLQAVTDGDCLRVEVIDTGIGIDAADLSQVFDRFFRSPSVRTSTVPGVGLGLLITKTIVIEHGGTISVTSEPGVGSTFTIRLPQDGEIAGERRKSGETANA